jgi:pimeloyl-ACP methyl ester carboxylesterase
MMERVWFQADDATPLSALVESPDRPEHAGRPAPGSSAVLLLPGFWRRAESERIRWLSQQLARRFSVYTLDFRGHGRSSGSFTFGRLEHLDVEALMRFARSRGVERVALVGMSMGAASIATTLGGDELPVEVTGAVLIAGPAAMSAIRPRPWRGSRDVAWGDMLHVPRVEWRVPFTEKRVPAQRFAAFPDVPVRLIHARSDWLVDPGPAERMHEASPQRSDFYLFETPGLHADEMLGRWRELVVRFVRPFVDAALAPARPPGALGDAGMRLDVAPDRKSVV